MPLRETISNMWNHIQDGLFPWLTEKVGPLTDGHRRVIAVLEVARVEELVQAVWRGHGRPPIVRRALARAFTAKAALDLPTTVMPIERLTVDKTLR
ncbi:MAG: IS5/IS1182 family transposase, partial [Hyphomicrobiaceae bacterium]